MVMYRYFVSAAKARTKTELFKCPMSTFLGPCNFLYSTRYNLSKHLRRFHSEGTPAEISKFYDDVVVKTTRYSLQQLEYFRLFGFESDNESDDDITLAKFIEVSLIRNNYYKD